MKAATGLSRSTGTAIDMEKRQYIGKGKSVRVTEIWVCSGKIENQAYSRGKWLQANDRDITNNPELAHFKDLKAMKHTFAIEGDIDQNSRRK